MRETTKALIKHYVDQLDLSGRVLEIGSHRPAQWGIAEFPEPRFAYHNLSLEASAKPTTINADITDCRDTIPDESFDIVISSDVLEHIDRPWLAAGEIGRILKPGGVAITQTPSTWGNNSGPVDYWRYSPESLQLLFGDLECLEKGYDLSDVQHRTVYLVGRNGSGPSVPSFQNSGHPLAVHLRTDTRGVVTDPRFSKTEAPAPADPVETLRPALAEITDRLAALEKLVEDRSGQLDDIDTRSRRLERRIDRAVASFPFRTVLGVRRWLHRMLK